MGDPRWEHIKAVFNAALAAAPADRDAVLDRECAGDADLRREVDSLLTARTQGGTAAIRTAGAAHALSDAASTAATPITERPGAVIGPYKLLQLIGEGGFGSVFMAEQQRPMRRRVALKIIKLGMDTRQVVARFEQERQALAMMDHPNIAKVLDAGATDTGRPYFVMELVKGEPITTYCDRNTLSIPERLHLFIQVCQAVQHAHTKGVIHRDIKPGNVLVSTQDAKPHAKVIDFGIAKATEAAGGVRLTDKTLFTELRQLIGTPEYMSPEQAEGSLDIDTRTDVYSLGVLLYELLVGTPPFDPIRLRSAAYGEMQRIIREVEPPTPSVRISRLLGGPALRAGRISDGADGGPALRAGCIDDNPHLPPELPPDEQRDQPTHTPGSESRATKEPTTLTTLAANRRTEPRRLSSIIKGELDWIVMKALEKDRVRRYETATGLAQDVGRYLAGEPVVAAPVSRVYRMRTFVRKNKGAVITGLSIAAAFASGLTLALWQWEAARKDRDNLKAVNARLQDSARKSAAGVGNMMDLLTGLPEGTNDPIYGHKSDGSTLAEGDPLGYAIAYGLQLARFLKEERDSLKTANIHLREEARRAMLAEATATLQEVDLFQGEVLNARADTLGVTETKVLEAMTTRHAILGPADPRTLEAADVYSRFMANRRRHIGGQIPPPALPDAILQSSKDEDTGTRPDGYMGVLANALEEYQQAGGLATWTSAAAEASLALHLERRGRFDDARSHFEKIVNSIGLIDDSRDNRDYPVFFRLWDMAWIDWTPLPEIGSAQAMSLLAHLRANLEASAATVDFRDGLYEQALCEMKLAISLRTGAKPVKKTPPYDLAVLAMAYYKCGNPTEARTTLAELRSLMADPDYANDWTEDVHLDAHIAEAESLVNRR